MSTPPKYLTAVLSAASSAPAGAITDVFVLHDGPCQLLAGTGPCNCSPIVTRGHTLWHRPNRRCAWKPLTTAATEREALDAIKTSGQRHGDWLVLPAGKQP